MPDLQRLIAEVAARNRIRIEPNDPLFAVVTLNQLVLEETMAGLLARVEATLKAFEASIREAEDHGGTVLGERLKECFAEAQRIIESQARSAWLRAETPVAKLHRTRTRIALVAGIAFALTSIVTAFCCGVWVTLSTFR